MRSSTTPIASATWARGLSRFHSMNALAYVLAASAAASGLADTPSCPTTFE